MHQCIMKTIEAHDSREAGEPAAEQTIAASDRSKSISRFSLMSETLMVKGKVHLCYPLKPSQLTSAVLLIYT